MTDVVIDSSFAVAILVEEEHSPYAWGILGKVGETPLRAPALIWWEVANALQMKVRRGDLNASRLPEFLGAFEDLMITLEAPPAAGVLTLVGELAEKHGRTIYDAAYLQLAVALDAELATIDKALTRAALAEGLTVHSPFA